MKMLCGLLYVNLTHRTVTRYHGVDIFDDAHGIHDYDTFIPHQILVNYPDC